MKKQKSLDDILDRLDEAFETAEKELIENLWYRNETESRQRMFVELADRYGSWRGLGDCYPTAVIEGLWKYPIK